MEKPDNIDDEPQALLAAAIWADSCLVCDDEDASVGNDGLNRLIDNLIENSPNLFNTSAENPHTTSLEYEQETISSAAQTSSSTKLSVPDEEDDINGDNHDFIHEKTNDPTRIRYRGEEYAIFEDQEQVDNDPNLEEVPTDFLVDIEPVENIFKVWDLRASLEDDDEEDELTLNLKEALEEGYLTRTAKKIEEDPITSLNKDQLNDLVNELTCLSLSPEQYEP